MKSLVFTFVVLSIILCGISCGTFMEDLSKVKHELCCSVMAGYRALLRLFHDPDFKKYSRVKFLVHSPQNFRYIANVSGYYPCKSVEDFMRAYEIFESEQMIPQFECVKYIINKYRLSSRRPSHAISCLPHHNSCAMRLTRKLMDSPDLQPLIALLMELPSFEEIMSNGVEEQLSKSKWRTTEESEKQADLSKLEQATRRLCRLERTSFCRRERLSDLKRRVFFTRSAKNNAEVIPIYGLLYFVHYIKKKLERKGLPPSDYFNISPEDCCLDSRWCSISQFCQEPRFSTAWWWISRFACTQQETSKAFNLQLPDDSTLFAHYNPQKDEWTCCYYDFTKIDKVYEHLCDVISHLKDCNMALFGEYVSSKGASGAGYIKPCIVETMHPRMQRPILSLCFIVLAILRIGLLFEKNGLVPCLGRTVKTCHLFVKIQEEVHAKERLQTYTNLRCDFPSIRAVESLHGNFTTVMKYKARARDLIKNVIDEFFGSIRPGHQEFLNHDQLCKTGCIAEIPESLVEFLDYFQEALAKDYKNSMQNIKGELPSGTLSHSGCDRLIAKLWKLIGKDKQINLLLGNSREVENEKLTMWLKLHGLSESVRSIQNSMREYDSNPALSKCLTSLDIVKSRQPCV